MSNGNPSPQPAAPQKKGMHGCLIALLVVLGLFFVLALVGVIAMIRYSQTPDGKKIFSTLGKVGGATLRGMNAPGTRELRELGCPQAMVIDVGQMSEAFAALGDGGTESEAGFDELMVMCQGSLVSRLPTCDKVAKTYVDAVGGAAKPFIVVVQTQGGGQSECRERYSASGEDLGPLETKSKHH